MYLKCSLLPGIPVGLNTLNKSSSGQNSAVSEDILIILTCVVIQVWLNMS